ncbi:hypothetical protein BHE74_00051533 [Ensete ventricosum]|nr:hypothetical protein GW17_00023149 [Ensete ventricosum]RWW42877.1 hypothetical protein BHE74_00051533 [Ensete ventricosum]
MASAAPSNSPSCAASAATLFCLSARFSTICYSLSARRYTLSALGRLLYLQGFLPVPVSCLTAGNFDRSISYSAFGLHLHSTPREFCLKPQSSESLSLLNQRCRELIYENAIWKLFRSLRSAFALRSCGLKRLLDARSYRSLEKVLFATEEREPLLEKWEAILEK